MTGSVNTEKYIQFAWAFLCKSDEKKLLLFDLILMLHFMLSGNERRIVLWPELKGNC